jgi:PPP family 3-phenylpropionic acid transporter
LIVSAIFAVFWQGILPVLDAVTLILARGGALEYGRARMWLSATYMVGNVGAGVLAAAVGMMIIMPSVQVCLVIFAAACLLVPRMPVAQRVEIKGRLEWKLPFFMIILVAGLIQASHGLLYSFASLHWLALGYSNTMVGVFWAVSVVAEVIVFSCSALFLRYFGPLRLLLVAALGATARWGLMSLDLGIGFQIGLQALHGVSFGMTYLAATRFIADTGPQARAASAQSLFGSVSGLSLAAATFGGGLLYARFDATAFAAMAVISAGAIVLLLVVWQGAARLLAEPLEQGDVALNQGVAP